MLERYALVAPWIAFALVWIGAAPFTKKTVRRQSMGSRWMYLGPILFAIVLLESRSLGSSGWLGAHLIPRGSISYGIGLVCDYAGVAFAIWARATLGSLWSGTITLKEGHRLVQSGPFSITRHPIYTAIIFAALGLAIAIGTGRALVGFVILVASFTVKLSREESLMAETFGEEHRAYRERVRKLVPFVW